MGKINALPLLLIMSLMTSCSKDGSTNPTKNPKVNTLIGSNPTSTGTTVTSNPVSTSPTTQTPIKPPTVTTPSVAVPVKPPVVVPSVPSVPSIPSIPSVPSVPSLPSSGPIAITPVANEQQLVSSGAAVNANGNWKGNCQISLNGKVVTSCFFELDILQGPDSFCPSTFYVSPYLSQNSSTTDMAAITAVSSSLIQYASLHMGLFGNNLMTILDCEILVNFDPGHQATRLGTVGQGGFKYKDAQGLVEMKGLYINNAWQISYKTGRYLLEAILQ